MTGGKNFIAIRHSAQHYSSLFNKKTGFFARIEDKGFDEPFWSESGPELLDISITNYCRKGCSFCYRHSTKKGKHMPFQSYANVISQAKESGVFQIALGGGNPNEHPNFIKILKTTSLNGIVPSYTSNGVGLTNEILKATSSYCGAMALSAYEPFDDDFEKLIERITNFGIKLNIHFLLTSKTINTAIDWLGNPPRFLKRINALIFLNYKPIYSSSDLLVCKSHRISEFFELVEQNNAGIKIGFDSCSVSGIVQYMSVNPTLFESCEAARFSAFISEDLKMFPCSFMAGTDLYGNLQTHSLHEIWSQNPYFVSHRNSIQNNNCHDCRLRQLCSGGCVFMPDINLCNYAV